MRSGFVEFHDSLEPLMCDIDEVRPHPDNARNGDIDLIQESIRENGFVAPVIAQRSTRHILAGNHRYFAVMGMDSKKIPVVWVDVDDTQAKRYLLVDNRSSDVGEYDNGLLLKLLNDLVEADGGDMAALTGSGYSERDLAMLQELNDMEQQEDLDFAQWPTLTFQVHPDVRARFYAITSDVGEDSARFAMLVRLAERGLE